MLSFTLAPEGCGRLFDALTCLARFSEWVTVEALPTQLVLTALNSSKSAFVKFALEKHGFFSAYDYASSHQRNDRSSYSLQNKALLSVFKGRLVDPRQKEDSLDRCEVKVEDRPDHAAYRFKFKMIYMHGVTKTYQLTYESVEAMHPLFDRNRATNQWKIQARLLREYVEYFAPKTEQLDIYPEDGRCTLLSFTEKIMRGKETLKQPLQTAVSIDFTDFIEFNATENLHIVINVKDFRHMVIHAETLKTNVAAAYSQPGRPLQFSYSAFGMRCEFTLMTIGESSKTTTQGASRASTREVQARQAPASVSGSTLNRSNTEMPPPQRPASHTTVEPTRRLGRRAENQPFPSQPDTEHESLFLPLEDDRQWEPVENQDAEDMLRWDASLDNDTPFHGTFRDSGDASMPVRDMSNDDQDPGFAPTQRASQIRGFFD